MLNMQQTEHGSGEQQQQQIMISMKNETKLTLTFNHKMETNHLRSKIIIEKNISIMFFDDRSSSGVVYY